MIIKRLRCFYSSPSCDGDPDNDFESGTFSVSILPRLATGINRQTAFILCLIVSILPRLATGIDNTIQIQIGAEFLFFPVLRRGSNTFPKRIYYTVSILPRLATGINHDFVSSPNSTFLFFPVLRRGSSPSEM